METTIFMFLNVEIRSKQCYMLCNDLIFNLSLKDENYGSSRKDISISLIYENLYLIKRCNFNYVDAQEIFNK